jgi:transcriptional regulator with XRE-family HTH domain
VTIGDVLYAREKAHIQEVIQVRLAALGINAAELARRLFGTDPKTNKPKSSGKVYKWLRGAALPTARTRARIEEALELTPGTLTLPDGSAPPPPPRPPKLKLLPPGSKPVELDRRPDQFSLVIDAEGSATLKLHLAGLPMGTAMRALGALTSIGILTTTEAGEGA